MVKRGKVRSPPGVNLPPLSSSLLLLATLFCRHLVDFCRPYNSFVRRHSFAISNAQELGHICHLPEPHPLTPCLRGATEAVVQYTWQIPNCHPFCIYSTVHIRSSHQLWDKDVCHYNQCHSSREYLDVIVLRTTATQCNQSI